MTDKTESADQAQIRTLPYSAVEDCCESIMNLSRALESTCSEVLSDYCGIEHSVLFNQVLLMQNTLRTIGLMADHCIGQGVCGDGAAWHDLPSMKEMEGESC